MGALASITDNDGDSIWMSSAGMSSTFRNLEGVIKSETEQRVETTTVLPSEEVHHSCSVRAHRVALHALEESYKVVETDSVSIGRKLRKAGREQLKDSVWRFQQR